MGDSPWFKTEVSDPPSTDSVTSTLDGTHDSI